jgi:glycosyltransferase involved in cell wall biosynthesis
VSGFDGPIILLFGIVDEVDIVRDFLDYHLSLGIERFVATDTGSTDGTLDILAEYERSGRLHLTRLSDPTVPTEHRYWRNVALMRARDTLKASWCLLCDPDEFWVFPDNDALSYLKAAPAPIVIFPRYNMLPLAAPETGEAVHHRNFNLVVRRPLEFLYDLRRLDEPGGVEWMLDGHPPDVLRFVAPKTLARADAVRAIMPGFHDVEAFDRATPRHRETQGYLAHFQVSGANRFINKARLVTNYVEANRNRDDRPSSRHWLRIAALYRHGLIKAEYARQLFSADEIAARLREGVIERDDRIAARLTRLADPRADLARVAER